MGVISKLGWYLHRLRAMDLGEVMARIEKRRSQRQDMRRLPDFNGVKLDRREGNPFPRIPEAEDYPDEFRESLQWEAWDIHQGNWKAFRFLDIKVDDPPRWQKDYLVGRDVKSDAHGFLLNHRELPDGADVKLIWELSRWNQLVRLAQAAHVLGDLGCGDTCLRWMGNWLQENPPLRGWNWTSPLESGMRLIQFCWIDALLRKIDLNAEVPQQRFSTTLPKIRKEFLAPHVYYTWRYRSVGSSANNHLLGELAGLILAQVRWPGLAEISAPLEVLQDGWEAEVLRQFSPDGGNREQALNYQLFSFEFCWQVRESLRSIGRRVDEKVDERLRCAALFFRTVQVPGPAWDYGDSDSAYVTPLFQSEAGAQDEWLNWLGLPDESPVLSCWLGEPPAGPASKPAEQVGGVWTRFRDAGIAVAREEGWAYRFDQSPLGYGSMAAHGHLDALHLSVWIDGQPLVIDSGTGAYYGDPELRERLADREAHNAPVVAGVDLARRMGPFLWASHHARPQAVPAGERQICARLVIGDSDLKRLVEIAPDGGCRVVDEVTRADVAIPFSIRLVFAPGWDVVSEGGGEFSLWNDRLAAQLLVAQQASGEIPCVTIEPFECSPSFRRTTSTVSVRIEAVGRLEFLIRPGAKGAAVD